VVASGLEGLVIYLAKALVDRPEQVEVSTSDVDGAQMLELRVASDDVGKVIGRDGRTINAIRSLVTAAALKQGKKARLEILDDRRVGTPGGPVTPKANGLPPEPAPQ
jgi:uncharacterized protein